MNNLNNNQVLYGVSDKHCAECNKLIIPTPLWAYKLQKGNKTCYYCSYKCYRKGGRR